MEQLIKKNFKDLNDMTLIVAERFFFAREAQSCDSGDYIAENDLVGLINHKQYIQKVCNAFSKLNNNERNLINNEFFFQSYHNWWESIYSKATFYRYKKKAMVNFLEAFYND